MNDKGRRALPVVGNPHAQSDENLGNRLPFPSHFSTQVGCRRFMAALEQALSHLSLFPQLTLMTVWQMYAVG